MAKPQHKSPCPGVIKFTILLDLSFVTILYTYFFCSTPGSRENNYKTYLATL